MTEAFDSLANITVPNVLSIVNEAVFEEFDELKAVQWTGYHTPTVIQISVAYLVSIFAIQWFMKTREAFELQKPLFAWNAAQALFSFLVVYNIIPEVIESYQASGIKGLDCDSNFMKGSTGAWHFAFVLSKVLDLVDTFFIVLRKRPLVFLHYYHHVATMVAGFAMYSESFPIRLVSLLNGSVHCIMYSYYAAAAMRIKIPGWLARWITRVQISQFVLGAAFGIHGTVEFFSEAGCGNISTSHLILGWFINLSFLTLFINFFRKSYVVGGGKQKYRDDSSEKKQE